MERVECTLCHRTFDDTTLLSLHQEYEGCFTTNPSVQSDKIVCCPICDKVFDDSIILQIHVNEEHDQNPVHTSSAAASARSKTTVSDSLYAQDLERRQRMKHKHEEESQAEASAEPSQEDQDAIIARMLQEEENAQSFEEFRVRALI